MRAVHRASEAGASRYRLVDQAADSHQRVVIAGKRGSAVLVSEEDGQAIQEPRLLLALPGMGKSVGDAMAGPLSRTAKEMNG